MSYRAKDHYRDEAVAEGYDAERFASRKGRLVDRREQSLIFSLIRAAGLRPPATLVDVPVGTGRLAASMAAAGYRVTGVDVSAQMIDRAKARLAALPESIRPDLAVGDAEAMPFEDASVDAVISLRLSGHLPPATRVAVLREFARVSRGHVIVAYYDARSLQGRIRGPARRGLSWNPVRLADIDGELTAAGLHRVARRFMLRGVSETVVVLARRRGLPGAG